MRKILKVILSIVLFFAGYLLTQLLVTKMYDVFPILLDVIPSTLKRVIMKLTFLPPAFILWKLLEKKPFSNMGMSLDKGIIRFLIGSLLGIISTLVITLLLWICGVVTLKSSTITFSLSIILTQLLFAFCTGLSEEIMMRGYITGVMTKFNNLYVVMLVPSAIFSSLHFFNSGFNVVGAVNTFLVGVMFTYMSYKTGNLWMAIGYHTIWNWSLLALFNLNVSGGGEGNGVFNFVPTCKSILGTTEYGPEGGLICTLVIIITLIIINKFFQKDTKSNYMKITGVEV